VVPFVLYSSMCGADLGSLQIAGGVPHSKATASGVRRPRVDSVPVVRVGLETVIDIGLGTGRPCDGADLPGLTVGGRPWHTMYQAGGTPCAVRSQTRPEASIYSGGIIVIACPIRCALFDLRLGIS
jgi:hypothetical protein